MSRRHHVPVPDILITVLRSSEFVYGVFFVVTGVVILRLIRRRQASRDIGFGPGSVRQHQPTKREEKCFNENANRSALNEADGRPSAPNAELFCARQH